MLKQLFHAQIARFERAYDYDGDYMHVLVDLDLRGFWKFSRIVSAGEYRAGLPVAAIFAVKLATTLHEDCGPCSQIVINLALAADVPAATLDALVRGDLDAALPEAALAFRFAHAVLNNAADLATVHDAVAARFGSKGPAILGLALCVARVFPLLKRAMGYAHTCVRLQIGESAVAPVSLATP